LEALIEILMELNL